MCYYIGLIVSITTTSSLACNAAKYTGRVVHRVIHKTWDPVILQKVGSFLRIGLRKSINKLRLFSVDNSFATTIVEETDVHLSFVFV